MFRSRITVLPAGGGENHGRLHAQQLYTIETEIATIARRGMVVFFTGKQQEEKGFPPLHRSKLVSLAGSCACFTGHGQHGTMNVKSKAPPDQLVRFEGIAAILMQLQR